MSRSGHDILATKAMLERLRKALQDAAMPAVDSGQIAKDAAALRRTSMTLHRWHELECGVGNEHGSWAIVRGHLGEIGFTHDDDGPLTWNAITMRMELVKIPSAITNCRIERKARVSGWPR